ncbi:bifunctional folylpolyglutamate synthase/dihydrofolate synthase [Pelagovum pacificum]|uniref:Dihydrofolate synthase/folylpolyglutamate synthase n=1 Tax=Pelagovum pacificum TaxID=2588711 RepID=A0A5C5GKD5_9RHOB|nr:folylpolyglutamate synthase/dihydrofolate synthase family protein [Pelagovum pacificum]QQA42630.1 bifunctional folylpolyglutamate synthase/dihydrofolate synthase [Pelagovum pacificum]TNY34219.1 bifunctional folylpolyglutamate synthase/dihydrofolate synthase [Pelagovum pacificum]
MSQTSDVILQRMTSLHPKIIDLTLDRMWRLLEALGNPQDKLPPVVHIAGTNGKGSTQAMLRAGLEAGGKVVHAYTSPHLARFHERIRLAGELITEDALTEVLDRCYEANGGEEITYFEITTCAGILAMSEVPADYTLLEVGLGGRLDATNVVAKPALTVITSVDYDHQQYLGDTLEAIAGEKAGILKRGVPCVVGRQHEEALEVIEAKAARLGAPLLALGQHWQVSEERGRLVYQDDHGLLDLPRPVLPGPHQIDNAGGVIAGLRYLGFGETECEAAMTQAEWPARMQRMTSGSLVDLAGTCELWLDGGHNPAAGEAMAGTLSAMAKKPTHMICGMLSTKDVKGYLRPLARHGDSLTAFEIPDETATLPAAVTATEARAVGFAEVTEAPDIRSAIRNIAEAHPGSRILICGSLYLAGHVIRENLA